MKTKRLLCLLVFQTALSALAQSNLPPVYELKADTGMHKVPDKYWQMLEDSSGKLTIQQLQQSPFSERFHFNDSKNRGIGYTDVNDFWQRVHIRNSSGKDLTIVFVAVPNVQQFDIYAVRHDGSVEHKISGTGIPEAKRDSVYRNRSAVPLLIKSGEAVVVYKKLHLTNQKVTLLDLTFYLEKSFLQKAYIDESDFEGDTRSSFIAGMLLFGFFLNLFFYLIVKDKLYLYYALFLFFEGVWYLNGSTDFFSKDAPGLMPYIDVMFFYLACFLSVVGFVREFLKIKRFYPKWDTFILVVTIVWIIFQLTEFFIIDSNWQWRGVSSLVQNTLFFIMMLALSVSFFLPKKQFDRFTNLSIAAALPAFIVWTIIYGLGSVYRFFDNRNIDIKPAPFVSWLLRNSLVVEMVAVGWFVLLFSWILLQKYALLRKQLTLQTLEREREKAELMQQQKIELEKQVEERTSELKRSLEDLRNTQKQLIQSEKMASLGELTAGIAHEIQNPLNFINNFSEVSAELAEEVEKEVQEGNTEEALKITGDLKQNLGKIVHHGRRADSIVKNMLQHSRQSTGEKQMTDINALVDECLRLSYHGLRAKDKSFNAVLETHFDKNVGKVNIVSQDIGRVLLNLFNNSFYSVMQKKKINVDGFEPTVSVSTKRMNNEVLINVRDNGLGIPKTVLDKIYQPFFTTKPSGEGTGLGLSMSYEIITKGHGGTLQAETEEGKFAEFNILLPA